MGTGRAEGKIALVTGGARGIGKAIAKKMLREGAKVVIADVLTDEAKKTAAEFAPLGVAEVVAYQALEAGQAELIVDFAVKTFGRLDILVNNAGVQKRCPAIDISEEVFDWVMDIDLKAPFFCSQAAARAMRGTGGGRIVSIASGNSRMMNPGRAPYCIAKAGINAMTQVLAAEWAMYGINVNAIAPGFIETEIVKRGFKLGILSEAQILSVTPIQRLATEDEVADSVFFFVSDEARYVTGQTLFCDGGWNTGILPNALDYIRHPEKYDRDQ
ncbi:MAG: glucose 1-dehydrogenase [Planctomycetes bacterium]|nr:glucose 1-dehydrogenase [Planctomycetota bacterium]